ncbi:unnamed protein product [Allacma fusca]|uniref:Uncharacterized protein n=1 Tax=Allacma fusca TaxID=39272 RepID=A0A8J2L4C0_9HEXA|nr:unnamed protein product [Allacma fusca]
MPLIKIRNFSGLHRPIQQSMILFGATAHNPPPETSSKGQCKLCDYRHQIRDRCDKCKYFVCKAHKKQRTLCNTCAEED